MQIELSTAADPAHRAAILAPLAEYNTQMCGVSGKGTSLGVVLRGSEGRVEGGIFGHLWADWFKVDYAFLPPHRRGQRLGARIVSTLEAAAVARGARGVWLQSFSFQAPGFYQKLGYREIAQLQDRPPGFHDSFLIKTKDFAQEGVTMVVVEDVAEADRAAIRHALVAYSDTFAGKAGWTTQDFLVRGDDGAIQGGLHAQTGRGWMFIDLLGLPPTLRRARWGTKLMDLAEAAAHAKGCLGVYLDTFSFQARPFYEKRGYKVFAEIDDYPRGHQRFFLSKRFDQA